MIIFCNRFFLLTSVSSTLFIKSRFAAFTSANATDRNANKAAGAGSSTQPEGEGGTELSDIFRWCVADPLKCIEDYGIGEPTMEQVGIDRQKRCAPRAGGIAGRVVLGRREGGRERRLWHWRAHDGAGT